MPALLELPDGLTQRALVVEDAAAVTAVMAAQELYDVGWSPATRCAAALPAEPSWESVRLLSEVVRPALAG